MGKETGIQTRILDYLNSVPGCKAINIHGSVHTEKGTPDIFCCLHGKAILLEVKKDNETSDEIQKHRHRQWVGAGARVAVVRSLAEVKSLLGHDVMRPDPFVIGS